MKSKYGSVCTRIRSILNADICELLKDMIAIRWCMCTLWSVILSDHVTVCRDSRTNQIAILHFKYLYLWTSQTKSLNDNATQWGHIFWFTVYSQLLFHDAMKLRALFVVVIFTQKPLDDVSIFSGQRLYTRQTLKKKTRIFALFFYIAFPCTCITKRRSLTIVLFDTS